MECQKGSEKNRPKKYKCPKNEEVKK